MIKIGFLPITIWDVLDVLIVGYLMYRIYKLLRGSISFNIFVGVITLLVTYWLVDLLNMRLLAQLLDSLVQIGVLIIVIIFQPEIRRFLLFLGDTTLQQRSNFWRRIRDKDEESYNGEDNQYIQALTQALLRMSKRKTGALIVLAKGLHLDHIVESGVKMKADVSRQLLESIFFKNSPLHDGAVVISDRKIYAASCILPVSDNPNLPSNVGLRHRAAVGITEKADVASFIVSEETGFVSYAHDGKLHRLDSEQALRKALERFF